MTSTPPISALRLAPLGKVSVVMIASADPFQANGEKSEFRPGSALTIFSNANGSPMTPVEATKIFEGRQDN